MSGLSSTSLRMKFIDIVQMLTLCLIGIQVSTLFGSLHLIFEVLSHFQVQYLFFSSLSVVFFALIQQKTWFRASILSFLLAFIQVVPWYFGGLKGDSSATESAKILISNVNTANRGYREVMALVNGQNPDIVGLIEVSKLWLNKLSELEKTYPYTIFHPRDDNFGLAIFSRHPLSEKSVKIFGRSAVPTLVCKIEKNGKKSNFILTHALPPLSLRWFKQRIDQLEDLGGYLANTHKNEPTVVAGDFNLAMFSPFHGAFESASKLLNTRRGFGIIPTWPQNPIFWVALDHIFVSKGIKVVQFGALSSIGSDHLPISAEIQF